MEIISLVLSGLALLAAGVSLILWRREKKRNEKQRAVIADYVDESDELTKCEVSKQLNEQLKATTEEMRRYIDHTLSARDVKIENLEKGITPDYEEQRKAVQSCNDFYAGINNILGYDPIVEQKRMRDRERMGGEDE